MKSIKIGTRGSALALYQTRLVRSELQKAHPELRFEEVKIKTQGDQDKRPLGELSPGIFTREIEEALLRGDIDLAVHSAKDLASELPGGLTIGAVLKREDPRDCLVAREKRGLADLKPGSRIGTSSLRRKAQIKKLRPDFEFCDLRGNVDTRVRKIQEGELDAMIIAYAGLKRLGLEQHAVQIFDAEIFLPQAGQGAIAVQIREKDSELKQILARINHEESAIQVSAERGFLRELRGGCQVPAGIYSELKGTDLFLKAAIFSNDGTDEVSQSISGPAQKAEALGRELGKRLLNSGGRKILEGIRNA